MANHFGIVWRVSLFLCNCFLLKPILFKPSVERCARYAEFFCRPCQVPIMFAHCLNYKKFLGFFELVIVEGDYLNLVATGGQMEIVCGKCLRVVEYDYPLNQVLKFPDVPGPMIPAKLLRSFFVESFYRFAVFL